MLLADHFRPSAAAVSITRAAGAGISGEPFQFGQAKRFETGIGKAGAIERLHHERVACGHGDGAARHRRREPDFGARHRRLVEILVERTGQPGLGDVRLRGTLIMAAHGSGKTAGDENLNGADDIRRCE